MQTPSAFSFAQSDIDHVLRLGGNADRFRERIVAEFEKQKPIPEIAAYLQTIYHGGSGVGGVTAWYAEDGIRLSRGKSARYDKAAQILSWVDAAERIGQLLEDGQFAANVELAEAESYERSLLAGELWNLYHDLSEDARNAGYLQSLSHIQGNGFPEESAWLAGQLANPTFRAALLAEYQQFLTAHQDDRTLLRFHYHHLDGMLAGLRDLDLPRKTFSTELAEVPIVQQFITENEIDAALTAGSGMAGGKGRIFAFFQESHTDKETVDFLKREYGIGGRSHALSGAGGSDEWHDGKGLRYKKSECPDVHLTWEKASKRIAALIRQGCYLTESAQAEYDKIQAEKALAEENAVEAQAKPPLRELHEQYQPIVSAAVSEDTAYRNACGHSDHENAVIEGNAAVRRAVLNSGDLELIRLYSDVPEFRQRLHREVIDETYPRLHEMLRPLSQDDIDDALRAWNGDAASKRAVVRYMADHAREKDTADWLAQEYGGDGKTPFAVRPESPEGTALPWPKVQRRIAQLIQEDRFLTGQEKENPGLDHTADYRLLDRLRADCDYFLGAGQRSEKHLWAGNVRDQIAKMRELYEALPEKPEWLTGEAIDRYAERMAPPYQVVVYHHFENGFDERLEYQTLEEAERVAQGYVNGTMEPDGFAYDGAAVYDLEQRTYLRIFGNYSDEAAQAQVAALRPSEHQEETAPDEAEPSAAPVYHVGDTVYLDRRAYQITELREDTVQLLPTGMDYPIFRVEGKERFETLLQEDSRNETITEFLPINPDTADQDLRDVLAHGLIGTPDKAELSELLRSGKSNAEIAQWLSRAYPDIIETMELETGDTADYRTMPEGIELEVLDEDEKRLAMLFFRWDEIAPLLRGLYARQLDGFGQEQAEPAVDAAASIEEPAGTTKPIEGPATVAPSFHSETVAVYPGGKNHLPYDVVVERLHVDRQAPTPPQTRPPENFRILDDDLGKGGPKEKFWHNIKAIATLKQIEQESRYATPQEQHLLSQYVGWGGLADAFDPDKPAWVAEYSELKELLNPEEYAAARASTLNAHYTSPTVIRAIYEAGEKMGFRSGNILEPSMGVGNFFGMLPESMAGSRLYGVELDSISGRIAKQLYPKADITVAGFETTDRRDFYDLAIGNVPFGQYQVNDKAYNKLGFTIHNYFFAKALDQVRPGGVVAFVTSRYTMDAKDSTVRRYLAQRAELLGAIRLPNNAFKANAGTDVVSDILFLQKRDRPIDIAPEWTQAGQTEEGFTVNQYFIDHPEMVLGRPTAESTQYGRQDYTVVPIEGLGLADQLQDAVKYIQGTYQESALPELGEGEDIDTSLPADPDVKNYSYTVVDGAVYYRENSRMVRPDLNATAEARVKGLVELRDCVQRLIDLEMNAAMPDAAIREQMAELNRLYDSFSEKYGLINDRANRLTFADDSSYYLLCALEVLDEDGRLERKADMFTKRTIKPHEAVASVDTAAEALAVSISEKACVDMGYMTSLTGRTGAAGRDLPGAGADRTGRLTPLCDCR